MKCVSDSVFFWEEVHWPPGGSFTLYFHDSRFHRKTVADCSVPWSLKSGDLENPLRER